MYLKKINFLGIRNLIPSNISFSPKLNFLYGKNASGKTSLIEAIYLLSLGRSFRTTNLQSIISFGEKKCVVSGHINCPHSQKQVSIGVEKSYNKKSRYQVNGQKCNSVCEITKNLPVQLIDCQLHNLISAGPVYRRKFLDWGVFHMEHSFLENWRSFQKLLQQRNAVLKSGGHYCFETKRIYSIINGVFIEQANKIDMFRHYYLQQLLPVLKQMVKELLGIVDLNLVYYSGWKKDSSLDAVLHNNLMLDQRYGCTHSGPHRADLIFLVGNNKLKEVLSRGQQKTFGCALMLARAILLKRKTGMSPLFLLDDFTNEIDNLGLQNIFQYLSDLDSQLFVTGVNRQALEYLLSGKFFDLCCQSWFHVERGGIKKC